MMLAALSGMPCSGLNVSLTAYSGTGADVAVDDAEREQRERRGRAPAEAGEFMGRAA